LVCFVCPDWFDAGAGSGLSFFPCAGALEGAAWNAAGAADAWGAAFVVCPDGVDATVWTVVVVVATCACVAGPGAVTGAGVCVCGESSLWPCTCGKDCAGGDWFENTEVVT
jgi:hypothetical protein